MSFPVCELAKLLERIAFLGWKGCLNLYFFFLLFFKPLIILSFVKARKVIMYSLKRNIIIFHLPMTASITRPLSLHCGDAFYYWRGKKRNKRRQRSQERFVLAHLAFCTRHSPCAPSLWLCPRTASARGHGQRPAAFRWSCRTSGWVRGRLPLLDRTTRRCTDAPDPFLSRSISLVPSGSWTASRKAAAPSPVPCCLHAGYPAPSPSPETLSWGARYWIIFTPFFPLLFLLWLWFSPCAGSPLKVPSRLLNLGRSLLQPVHASAHSTWRKRDRHKAQLAQVHLPHLQQHTLVPLLGGPTPPLRPIPKTSPGYTWLPSLKTVTWAFCFSILQFIRIKLRWKKKYIFT